MKQPRWAKDAEAAGFLREAKELIEGKASNSVDRSKKLVPEK
jgi:hypothetical protein